MRTHSLLFATFAALACFFASSTRAGAQSPCAADITGDRVVNAADLAQVLIDWGLVGKGLAADIDGDAVVSGEDMAAVLNHWGAVCPWITGVSPVSGPPAGGTTITVTGIHFGDATELWIGDQMAHKLAVVDDGTLTAVVPASTPAGSTGERLLTVVTGSGQSSLELGFTYLALEGPTPWVQYVSPKSVPAAGGATVTITGSGFTGATAVAIDGIASSFTVVSDTQVTAIAPAHARGGQFNVSVTTPGGTSTGVDAISFWQAPPWPCTVLEVEPDPAVVYDLALQDQILRTGFPWRISESAVGIEMLLIPNGTYYMGCTASASHNCQGRETPNHWVTLTQPFYLGRYEVTQAQWQARTGSNPSYYQGEAQNSWFYKGLQVPPYWDASQAPNCPVESMSWNDIVNDFQPGTGLRLPTEAEWEYACRAGTVDAFHGFAGYPYGFYDDSLIGDIAWYGGCSTYPTQCGNSGYHTNPVGQKAANGFGLYDMAGNVAEYYADCQDDNYYKNSPSTDPPGTCCTCGINDSQRGWRGGSFMDESDSMRCSFREGKHSNSTPSNQVGFRVARTP